MDNVVDLREWLRGRAPTREASRDRVILRSNRAAPSHQAAPGPNDLPRLEAAVERVCSLLCRALDRSGRLHPEVETELLAIMGELAVGLVGDAALRAERLADRLASGDGGV